MTNLKLETQKDNKELSPSRKLERLKIEIKNEFQIKYNNETKRSLRDGLTDRERGKKFLDELKAKGPDLSCVGKTFVK